jgi:hypothetical protein
MRHTPCTRGNRPRRAVSRKRLQLGTDKDYEKRQPQSLDDAVRSSAGNAISAYSSAR